MIEIVFKDGSKIEINNKSQDYHEWYSYNIKNNYLFLYQDKGDRVRGMYNLDCIKNVNWS